MAARAIHEQERDAMRSPLPCPITLACSHGRTILGFECNGSSAAEYE